MSKGELRLEIKENMLEAIGNTNENLMFDEKETVIIYTYAYVKKNQNWEYRLGQGIVVL